MFSSAVPAPAVPGGTALPWEQGDCCPQRFPSAAVTAQVGLMQRDEAFSLLPLPFPTAGAMGAASQQPRAAHGPAPDTATEDHSVLGGLQRWRNPFLEAAETRSGLKLHRGFSLRVHPRASTSQHSSLCSGGVGGCMVRMPHKVWPCCVGRDGGLFQWKSGWAQAA